MPRRIVFISTMVHYRWGGSEELWSRAALNLAGRGVPVSASIAAWSPLHPRIRKLQEAGVEVTTRPRLYSPFRRLQHHLLVRRVPLQVADFEKSLADRNPALVVISNGGALPPVEFAEVCIARKIPFVTIGHANDYSLWPDDDLARRYREALPAALSCYFVSKANLSLAEKQIGARLSNSEVVWNPFNTNYHEIPAWPSPCGESQVRLACVGRLHPPSKGQDILFEALAGKLWLDRPWRLYLYGEGTMREGLARLAEHLGISDRVVFEGYKPVAQIWASNHVLVMPSRYEGLPLAMVEAMLCARPVIATNVAGHSEIVDDGVTGFLADAPTVNSMAQALERFWARRDDAEAIGMAGAQRIRQLVPPDPAGIFADKLMALVD
jgi:glycosyltransferase involved in cell wall biosynthesis